MSEALPPSSPVSPPKPKFSLEQFEFKVASSATSPNYPPVSPIPRERNLPASTASPPGHFLDASPTTPLTLGNVPKHQLSSLHPRLRQIVLPPPPSKPLNWIWQCHVCRSRYPLSVTRRCLIDGHYYCSGETAQQTSRRRRKPQTCTSEFDYVGWQDWGQWRRKCTALREFANGKAVPKVVGCEGCCFPSQCRYENRPVSETLNFEKYVDESDLAAFQKQEMEEPAQSGTGRPRGSSNSNANETNNQFTEQELEGPSQLQVMSETNATTSAGPGLDKLHKRTICYPRLTGTHFTIDLSPTSEHIDPFERGKFAPTLPLVTAAITSSPLEPVRQHPSDLDAIEATLKAALVGPNAGSRQSTSAPSTSEGTSEALSIGDRSVSLAIGRASSLVAFAYEQARIVSRV